MTAAGYARLEKELKELKSTARPAVIQAIATAREHGDLSENAEYHAAKEQQSLIEGRIAELQDKLSRAEVIAVASISGRQIKFGATILLASHNMQEVERLCDDVLMMRAGRIVDRGAPAELTARYGRHNLEEVFLDIARQPGTAPEAVSA